MLGISIVLEFMPLMLFSITCIACSGRNPSIFVKPGYPCFPSFVMTSSRAIAAGAGIAAGSSSVIVWIGKLSALNWEWLIGLYGFCISARKSRGL